MVIVFPSGMKKVAVDEKGNLCRLPDSQDAKLDADGDGKKDGDGQGREVGSKRLPTRQAHCC